MLARSLIAVLLSIPATVAVIGVLLAITPADKSLSVALLLLAFPLWVGIASASYLLQRPAVSAFVLIAVSALGLGLVQWLKFAGLAGIS